MKPGQTFPSLALADLVSALETVAVEVYGVSPIATVAMEEARPAWEYHLDRLGLNNAAVLSRWLSLAKGWIREVEALNRASSQSAD